MTQVIVTNQKTSFDADTNTDYPVDVGAGPVSTATQRTTLASDDPAVVSLASIASKDFATETTLTALAAAQQTDALTDAELRATPVPVSGSITANAGTNLNTSALALEAGNLATIAGKDFATSAKQDTIIGHIDGIESALTTLNAKDFATQTTLALIKAKTDNLDTALSGIKTGTDKIPASPATDRATAGSPFSVRLSDGSAFYKATTPSDTQPISNANLDVALSTRLSESDFDTKVGSLTESAPGTDTASSGLNGRLQRIAQRLTSLIALVPAALTGSGNFKVSLQESNASQAVTYATTGSGTSTGAIRVELPTNGTGTVGLNAGTNTIGKLAANSGVDIGDVDVTSLPKSATGTQTSVNDTSSSTTILASNASRLGASIMNDSSAVLYLRLSSSAASSTTYTVRMVQYGYYEVPFGYTGAITGIWASDPNDGGARVTEYT